MISFDSFQTVTATMKKITTSGTGTETVADSFTVNIDPTFGWKRVFTNEGEEISGQSTIITASNLQTKFDGTHRKWRLDYDGFSYQIEKPVPFYTKGTDNLEFLQVVLR